MYNKTLTAALAVAILGSGATFAADKPGADWISLEQAVEKAKAAGYTELHGIEADDDGWEGEGMKQDGKKYAHRLPPGGAALSSHLPQRSRNGRQLLTEQVSSTSLVATV